jgi:hypothetical protein
MGRRVIYVYVDNSNVFIGGRQLAAVQSGLARDIETAMTDSTQDPGWNLDYGSLYHLVTAGASSAVAKLWGSVPPGDSLWDSIREEGFDVQTFERAPTGKEKKVDAALVTEMCFDAHSMDPTSEKMVLVAGDKDYVPAIERIQGSKGISVEVWFWRHSVARELSEVCKFVPLDPDFKYLSRWTS